MQKQWFTEISRYFPRIEVLPARIQQALTELSYLKLSTPMEHMSDERPRLIIQLVIFSAGTLRVSSELTKAAELLFRQGRITSTCLQFRLLYEFWAATAYASHLSERVRDEPMLDEIACSIDRLVQGSRSPVRLPWGGETPTTSFNVMKFIQHLERRVSGTEETYNFLCETCHPSHFQQTYLWMAGSEGDNWTNDVFREHTHTLLEKLIVAGEGASLGLAEATQCITAISMPFVAGLK